MDNDIRIKALTKLYRKLYSEGEVRNQEDFAKKISRTKTYVSDLMNGNKEISNKLLKNISNKLGGIDLRYFDDPDNIPLVIGESGTGVSGKWQKQETTLQKFFTSDIPLLEIGDVERMLTKYPTEEIPQIPQDYRHVDVVNAINLLIAIENKRREKNKHDKDSK